MRFKASLDTTATIITGLILAFPVFLFLIKHETIWVDLFLLSLFLFCFAIAPLYYRLTDSELIIKRLLKPVRIPLAEIKTVQEIPEAGKMAKASVRTFGVGGLFGYFGKFWNKDLGTSTWYLTNFKNVIKIETRSGKIILISPESPEMLRILKEKLPVRQPQAA